MFLQLPFEHSSALQHAALIVNTVLLIGALIAVELLYAESTKDRKQLKYFLPLFFVLSGLLLYALYEQVGKT